MILASMKMRLHLLKYLGAVVLTAITMVPLTAQVQLKPDDRDKYAARAKADFDIGHWEAGKKTIDEGLKKYPKDSDLKMLSGKYYHHKKQYDKARYELIKSLEQNPGNVDAKHILVNVETESKRYSSAICYVNELLEVNPYWRGLWRKKIELYELDGNTVEANRLRKRIAQIYPEDSKLKADLIYNSELEANDKRRSGKLDEAIEIRKQLIAAETRKPEHYLMIVNDYLQAGDQANAMAYVERGLNLMPANSALINKKLGILAEQKRYNELLPFLQQQIRKGNTSLQSQYNYYLLEAARNAKEQDPATLYGKIFDKNPGDDEAFSYVFNNAFGNQQYEEALSILSKYRRSRGNNKSLDLKELVIYQRTGNTSRANSFTKELFARYPGDSDLKAAYVKIVLEEAKAKMADENYAAALADWQTVKRYGDREMYAVAQANLYNAYLNMDNYNNAMAILTEMIAANPGNAELYLKKSDIYKKTGNYDLALAAYEQAIDLVNDELKPVYLGGYGDMLTGIIKGLNEQFRFKESMDYVQRWLQKHPKNKLALHYAVNISNETKNREDVIKYATLGAAAYPADVFFKLKLIQINGLQPENFHNVYAELEEELKKNPYHPDVVNTFVQLSEDFGKYLIKNSKSEEALVVLDKGLVYAPNNKTLKYLKGTAYEKLKDYENAYIYQSFYEPSLLELAEFKHHLAYLKSRTYKNQVGFSHLRSRFGDNYTITSISSLEYIRFAGENTYTGRAHYAGREAGKGVQLQAEWDRQWNINTRTKINAAWANQFFPSISINASVYRELNLMNGLEAELGAGYRKLPGGENLMNIVLGATKQFDPWRINTRFNNFMLDGTYLYNLSADTRYYFATPKSYLMAVGSFGSSPDVDLLDYQLYNGFSVLNTMVGLGGSHMIYRSVSAGLLGSWHNYQTNSGIYKNLYNIHLSIHVAF